MAYWIITDKVLDKSSIETPFIILGPPGQHRWIYSLVNEKTKKLSTPDIYFVPGDP
jgi:hypothetical protein